MSKLITYRNYQTLEEAQEIVPILEAEQISYEIEDSSRAVSDFIIGQDTKFNILLKIKPEDFERANALLGTYAAGLVKDTDPDHYLFGFENQELLEIITEPDNWSEYDFHLAKRILNDRGIPITSELEATFQQKRKTELLEKAKPNQTLVVLGYLSAFLGGAIGIAVGLNLWTMKKTLPNGERVYVYAEKDRRQGQIITILGIVVLLASVYMQGKLRGRY